MQLFCAEVELHIGSKPPVKIEMPEAGEITVTCVGDTCRLHKSVLGIVIIKAYGARRRRSYQLLPVLQARVVRQSMPSVQTLATPSVTRRLKLVVYVFVFCCAKETYIR